MAHCALQLPLMALFILDEVPLKNGAKVAIANFLYKMTKRGVKKWKRIPCYC